MCGLNQDPYVVDDPAVGRLRHLYVHPDNRRTGIAARLVAECLASAATRFERVRLRTSNPTAATLYRSLGFINVDSPTATHELRSYRQRHGPGAMHQYAGRMRSAWSSQDCGPLSWCRPECFVERDHRCQLSGAFWSSLSSGQEAQEDAPSSLEPVGVSPEDDLENHRLASDSPRAVLEFADP